MLCKLQFSNVVLHVLSAKCGGLGMGGDTHNQNMPKQSPEPGGHCRRGKACASTGLTSHQVTAAVAGWIQVPSDLQSHAFQGERKGLKIFFSPDFSAECNLQIPLERGNWFSLLDFVSWTFLSALCCSMLHFSELLALKRRMFETQWFKQF